MAYTKITDLITGAEGSAFITIDGENRYFFELAKIDAEIEFTIIAKRLLGHRMKQHKCVGAEGKGSVTLYNVSPTALKIYNDYMRTGRTPNISIQVTNEDNSTTIGRRAVVLRNCVFAKLPVISLEGESEELSQTEAEFTFDDIDDLESFVLPENMR